MVQCLITGVYRSGTEFVSQLVSGHSDLSSTMYHVNALRWVDPLEGELDALKAIQDIASRIHSRYALTLPAEEAFDHFKASPGTRCDLYNACMTALWGKPHWSEKCQLLWREIPEFIRDMPDGRAVLVIRDPRSVMVSFQAMTNAPGQRYMGAIFNCLDAMQTAIALENNPRVLILKYEDIAQDAEQTSRRMFEFLGLEPATYDPSSWTDENGNPWVANTAFSRPFTIGGAINRWYALWTPMLETIEHICKAEMQHFGYRFWGNGAGAHETMLSNSEQVYNWYLQWLETGKGVQAFPTDPKNPENWG